ncbi:hypothetical protein GCM10010435_91510 [Winogradskya consettensis]|uniref:DUF1772 domain-containing protein n=2 Tax=Winogradskya consettensis TaxID=113560 RepID=A0A919T0Q6_9ACTN|nr:hypothetical protein Aco04nite_76650 [Actinoplanes consettensis]
MDGRFVKDWPRLVSWFPPTLWCAHAMITAPVALLAAVAAHAGFQVSVTVLVYPALARVPGEGWTVAHAAHSRAITPLVAVVYGLLAAASGWALFTGPGAWTLGCLAAVAVAVSVTVVLAAPAHGRLAAGHDPALLQRLLRADRVRAVAAVLATLAAIPAVW